MELRHARTWCRVWSTDFLWIPRTGRNGPLAPFEYKEQEWSSRSFWAFNQTYNSIFLLHIAQMLHFITLSFIANSHKHDGPIGCTWLCIYRNQQACVNTNSCDNCNKVGKIKDGKTNKKSDDVNGHYEGRQDRCCYWQLSCYLQHLLVPITSYSLMISSEWQDIFSLKTFDLTL